MPWKSTGAARKAPTRRVIIKTKLRERRSQQESRPGLDRWLSDDTHRWLSDDTLLGSSSDESSCKGEARQIIAVGAVRREEDKDATGPRARAGSKKDTRKQSKNKGWSIQASLALTEYPLEILVLAIFLKAFIYFFPSLNLSDEDMSTIERPMEADPHDEDVSPIIAPVQREQFAVPQHLAAPTPGLGSNGSSTNASSNVTPQSDSQSPSPPSNTRAPVAAAATEPAGIPRMTTIQYVTPMPFPGTPGAPFFSGRNVTDFLERFDDFCKEYGVNLQDKLKKLPRYCEKEIGSYVKSIPEFQYEDWEGLCKVMRKDYRKEDLEQQLHSRDFLNTYSDKVRTEQDDLKQYCRQYNAISHSVYQSGQLGEYERALWFVKGLPARTQERVIRKAGCDASDASTMKYDRIYKVAAALADTSDTIQGFRVKREEQIEYSALADSYQAGKMPSTNAKFAPPVTKTAAGSMDQVLDGLTKQMGALAMATSANTDANRTMQVLVNSLQRGSSLPSVNVSTSSAPAQASNQPTVQVGTQPVQPSLQRPNVCYFCEEDGHIKPRCPHLQTLQANGDVYLDDRNRVCMGRREYGGESVRKGSHPTYLAAVRARLQEVRNMQISTVRTSAIRLGSTADDGSSDEDSNGSEEEFDDRVFVEVCAARTDPKKGMDERGVTQQRFDPASRIWKEKSKQESRLPAVKNLRPGKYVSPTVNDVVEVEEVHDHEMKDVPAASKAAHKKLVPLDDGLGKTTKSVKLADMIKEEADPEAMLDLLLNQPVQGVSVRQMLSLSPQLQKLFFRRTEERPAKPIKQAKAASVRVGLVGYQDTYEVATSEKRSYLDDLYAVGCPVVRVNVNENRVKTLIDSGAEVNLISERLAVKAGIPIRGNAMLNMVAATGDTASFVGVAENVEVEIGGVVVPAHCFVVPRADYDLVLGRPFERKARLKVDNQDDGACRLTMLSLDGTRRVSFQGTLAENRRNRCEADVFPQQGDFLV